MNHDDELQPRQKWMGPYDVVCPTHVWPPIEILRLWHCVGARRERVLLTSRVMCNVWGAGLGRLMDGDVT